MTPLCHALHSRHISTSQSVYVDPSHRRIGLFRKLYQHARAAAVEAGAAGVRLYADMGNLSAHATYERMGMTSHYKV